MSLVKDVKAQITRIHEKGFAFAETAKGVSIFIPPDVREALEISRHGQRVQLKVKRGEKGWAALMPPSTSSVSWEDWQVGEKQVVIPDTQPGSLHTISFACWRCGETLAEADEIFKFKEGTFWAHSELAHGLKRGKPFENKWKLAAGVPVRGFSALCGKCGHNVGSIYPERFDEAEPELSFPCVKLYHARERVANDAIINSTVVVGDTRESAEYEISRLVRIHDTIGGAAASPARVQVRTTATTHDHIQRAKAAEEQRRLEEEQRRAAEERLRAEAQRASAEAQQRVAAQRAAQAAVHLAAQQRAAALAAENAALAEAQREAQRREMAEAEKAKEVAARADAEARLAKLSLHAEGMPVFECEVTQGDFRPYPAEIQEQLLLASSARDFCVWEISGQSYQILWGDDDNSHNQINRKTHKIRRIRVTRGAATPKSVWSTLSQGVGSESEVRAFFEHRQRSNLHGARGTLRIESIVKVENAETLGNFQSAGYYDIDPRTAHQQGDTLLFHGCPQAVAANIQATGLLLSHAANGMLGRGLYGAPDPRKSAQYCGKYGADLQSGKFMFICRFNVSNARYHQNQTFDEFCVYDERHVVVLWMLKLA